MRIPAQKVAFILALLIAGPPAAAPDKRDSAFSSELRSTIVRFDSAYTVWEESTFLAVDEAFKHLASLQPANHLPYYWQGVVQFHLVSYYLFGFPEHKDTDAAKQCTENALASLSAALTIQPGDGESLALLGTLTGIKIFLNPVQAPVLGPKVMSSIREALAADSTNPRVYYLAGVSYYNTPAILGGGADKALEYLLKAENLYTKEATLPPAPLLPRWGRSTCRGFIAKAYTKKNNYHAARTWYRKALDVNPSDEMARVGLQELDTR